MNVLTHWPFPRAKVIRVVDGDTFELDLDHGCGITSRKMVRLAEVDVYETSRRGGWDDGLSEDEIAAHLALGEQAEARVRDFLPEGSFVRVTGHSWDKYGRLVAAIEYHHAPIFEGYPSEDADGNPLFDLGETLRQEGFEKPGKE